MSETDREDRIGQRFGPLAQPESKGTFVAGRWGLDSVLFVAAAMFLAIDILQRLIAVPEGAIVYRVALTIPGFLLVWLLGVMIARIVDKRGMHVIGLGPQGGVSFLRGVLWYLPLGAMWWLIVQVQALVIYLFNIQVAKPPLEEALLRDGLTGPTLAVWILGTCVAAPLGEEMLFRGLLHGWLRRFLSFVPTAILCSVLWSAMHVAAVKIVPLTVLGLMLAWMRERPSGLWGCIGFHATHNAVTLLFLWMIGT